MANWRDILSSMGEDAEAAFTRLARRLDDRFGRDPLSIAAYRGYGSSEQVVLRGRVLEATGVRPSGDNDSLWANLLNTYRRFETDEVPGAQVLVRFAGAEQVVTADDEGFFEARLSAGHVSAEHAWHPVELKLVAPTAPGEAEVRATGEVFIPQPAAQFGVISDIDDTVVRTDATNVVRMARTVFLGNAQTRLPFPGVAALYRALHAGAPGPFVNPLFYVSSSPWNIYDMLTDFFELRGIPSGAMFLRDWGIKPGRLPMGHREHKLAAIRELLDFYPQLPFLLIGDSGQKDPEIYAEAVRLYPNRIRAIYIRNVDPDRRRIEAIRLLTEEVVTAGCTLILADDTLAMAQHAALQGWITPAALDDVAADKAADEGEKNPVEALLDEQETEIVATDQPVAAADSVEASLEESQQAEATPTIIVDPAEKTDQDGR